MMKKIVFLFLTALTAQVMAQGQSSLTVEKIMQDPKWIGTAPDGIFWDLQSKHIYFNWNPESEDLPSLYRISPDKPELIEKVSPQEQQGLIRQHVDRKSVV